VLDDGWGVGRWLRGRLRLAAGGTVVPAIPAPLASRPFAAGPGKNARITAVHYHR